MKEDQEQQAPEALENQISPDAADTADAAGSVGDVGDVGGTSENKKPSKSSRKKGNKAGGSPEKDWTQGGGPKKIGDTKDKGVTVVDSSPPTTGPFRSTVTRGGKTEPEQGVASPNLNTEEITKRIHKAIEQVSQGLEVREVEVMHREVCVGIFQKGDFRPICAVAVENGRGTKELVVLGYSFASNRLVESVIKPVMKEFGQIRYQPFSRSV